MTEKENAAPGWHPDTAEDAFDFQLPSDDSADAAAGAGAFPVDWNCTDRFRSQLEAGGEDAIAEYLRRLARLVVRLCKAAAAEPKAVTVADAVIHRSRIPSARQEEIEKAPSDARLNRSQQASKQGRACVGITLVPPDRVHASCGAREKVWAVAAPNADRSG